MEAFLAFHLFRAEGQQKLLLSCMIVDRLQVSERKSELPGIFANIFTQFFIASGDL